MHNIQYMHGMHAHWYSCCFCCCCCTTIQRKLDLFKHVSILCDANERKRCVAFAAAVCVCGFSMVAGFIFIHVIIPCEFEQMQAQKTFPHVYIIFVYFSFFLFIQFCIACSGNNTHNYYTNKCGGFMLNISIGLRLSIWIIGKFPMYTY